MLKYMCNITVVPNGLSCVHHHLKVGCNGIAKTLDSKTEGYLIDYKVEDSDELNTYIKYFAQTIGYDYAFTLEYIKHLPIRRKDA